MIDWKLAEEIWNEPPTSTTEKKMVKRSYNMPDNEPDQIKFEIPSAKEHLFQVTDVFTHLDEMGGKLGLDENTVAVKCEIVGGEEEGRTLLQRLSLDENWKGFFVTRLFLKAIGEEHKGHVNIDTDHWIGRQFYAVVIHNTGKNGKTYANIDAYDFTKVVEQYNPPVGEIKNPGNVKDPSEIAWEE